MYRKTARETNSLTSAAARGGRCGRQPKVVCENRLAAFLGDPDHPVRADCHVLHDARAGACNREGKSAADILWADAAPAGLNGPSLASPWQTSGDNCGRHGLVRPSEFQVRFTVAKENQESLKEPETTPRALP